MCRRLATPGMYHSLVNPDASNSPQIEGVITTQLLQIMNKIIRQEYNKEHYDFVSLFLCLQYSLLD